MGLLYFPLLHPADEMNDIHAFIQRSKFIISHTISTLHARSTDSERIQIDEAGGGGEEHE